LRQGETDLIIRLVNDEIPRRGEDVVDLEAVHIGVAATRRIFDFFSGCDGAGIAPRERPLLLIRPVAVGGRVPRRSAIHDVIFMPARTVNRRSVHGNPQRL